MVKMTITNIVLWIVFLLNFGLGLLVYFRDPKKRINISFSIFTWALAGWILGVSMFFLFKEPELRLFWARITFFSASIILAAFFYSVLGEKQIEPPQVELSKNERKEREKIKGYIYLLKSNNLYKIGR